MGEGALADIFEEKSLLSSAIIPRTNFDLGITHLLTLLYEDFSFLQKAKTSNLTTSIA